MSIRTLVCGVAALSLVGCGPAKDPWQARYEEVSRKGPMGTPVAARAAEAAPSPAACDLRLYIEQQPTEGIYGIGHHNLGVAAVTTVSGQLADHEADAGVKAEAPAQQPLSVTDGVCVKQAGKEVALPAPIQIAGVSERILWHLCTGAVKNGKTAAGADVLVCEWNGRFPAARPFTFTFVTAEHERVADFVDYVRIYRNGDLMAAWNSAAVQPVQSRVVLGGESLRAKWLSVSQPPNEAALDLRIIPRGDAVGQAVDTTVRNDKLLFEKKLLNAGKSAFAATFPKDSPIRTSFDCIEKTAQHVRAQVLHMVNGELPVESPPDCDMPLQTVAGSPLSDAYRDAKNQTEQGIVRAKNATEKTLEDAKQELEKRLPPAAVAALDKMLTEAAKQLTRAGQDAVTAEINKKHPDLASYLEALRGDAPANEPQWKTFLLGAEKLADDIDAEMKLALGAVDEARALALQLGSEVKAVANDPNRQAKIFSAVAQSFTAEGDTFEDRKPNPPTLNGEQALPMRYADPLQFYLLAPWNGVPIRTGSNRGGDFNAAVAIPLIDLFGGRYQFGSNRFADLRFAFGIGYTSTESTNPDKTVTKRAAGLPYLSIGAANLKFGVGYVTTESDAFKNHIRLIIGADLFKLISGKNVELL